MLHRNSTRYDPVSQMDMASDSGTVRIAAGRGRHPASVASARLSRATLALGGLGIASSLFVVSRLAGSWHVAGGSAARRISIFGQELSYPSANLDAIVVLGLALVGLAVTMLVLAGVLREWVRAERLARRLSRHASRGPHGTLLIEDEEPRAFCAGLLRPRVYVTTGAVSALDPGALGAVIAHELHHARRRDPLRFATEHVLARSLFFVPGIGELARQHRGVAELSADENAVTASPGNRAALARAMLSFSDQAAGIDPARVDFLVGEPPSWRFPLVLSVAGAAVLALVVAVSALAGRAATGSATLSLPLLSRQPCVVVLAMVPVTLGILAVLFRKR